jgi:hypothetical protein
MNVSRRPASMTYAPALALAIPLQAAGVSKVVNSIGLSGSR